MFNQASGKRNIYSNVIKKDPVEVFIQTTEHHIQGKIHIRPEERIKEEMNQPETFLVVTDATIFDKQGKYILYRCNFLVLNRTQVVWIFPKSESNNPEITNSEVK